MIKNYCYLIIFSIILFIGQLLTGTQLNTAFLFSIAILFGLCAVFATGNWTSMFGLLNLALIFNFLLFGVILKTLFLQPSDSPLLAPTQTAMVTALGFAGVLLGTLIYRKLPRAKTRLIYTISDKNFYLALYLFSLIAGYGSWLYVYLTRQGIDDVSLSVGGVFGVLGAFGGLKCLSISAAIYYVWLSKSKRLLSHPLVLFTLVLSLLVGIYSTSKQEIVEPLLYLVLTILQIKGVRYKPLWGILIILTLLYVNFIYPFSYYIRNAGGREGSTAERITIMSNALSKMAVDEEYRNSLTTSLSKSKYSSAYLPIASNSLGRFAMVSEADKLIAASTNSEETGWETINWGFKMLLPRFINSTKPVFAANNYLAHIVGELNPRDTTTQVSYGFMANFYNAFGFTGVIVGSTLLISSLYYWLSLFFGNPANLNIWVILVFGQYNHNLTEMAVSGIIASITSPVITLIAFLISKNTAKLLH